MNLLGIRRTQEEEKARKKLKRKGHEKTEEIGVFLANELHESKTVSEEEEDN
jgi:hypothetical protein